MTWNYESGIAIRAATADQSRIDDNDIVTALRERVSGSNTDHACSYYERFGIPFQKYIQFIEGFAYVAK